MLPILAIYFASCEKVDQDLSGDDIIPFKDENFLKALLTVQEIEIYDDESDDFMSYVVDVDKNKDGQISVNEAKDVKGLLLNDSETFQPFNVTDIAEIKYFTALTYLSCERNLLTTLDVSNNTALTGLYCNDNQLISLDIRTNTALVELNCDGNQLASLDLGDNTALKYLWCYDNQLTTLDVSGCQALVEFFCEDNPLSTLTISASQQNASWLNDVKSDYPDIEIIVK